MIRRRPVACSWLLEGLSLAQERGLGTIITQLILQDFRGAMSIRLFT